jgi:hypothetical protein
MKNKLKKDLQFLKPIKRRVFIAIGFSLIPGIIAINETYGKRDEKGINFILTVLVFTAIFLLALYLLTAWLYGNEENNNETNK